MSETATLNTATPDDCCGPRLAKALESGALEGRIRWDCPKCGTPWYAELHKLDNGDAGVKHWAPQPLVQVFRAL